MLFSAIIPTYNRPHELERALQSVYRQNHRNFEVIVIDDNSQSDYLPIIEKFKRNSNFRYLKNPANLGPAHSRNVGLAYAIGSFICFLDDDDEWLPNHLECMHNEILNHPEGILFHSGVNRVKAGNGEFISKYIPKKIIYAQVYFFENPCITSTVTIRKDSINDLRFREELRYPEDYLFWLQVSTLTPFYSTGCVTANYYTATSNSLTQQKTDFIIQQRLATVPHIINNKKIHKKYRKIYESGTYFKITRELLNTKTNIKLAIHYLSRSVSKWPLLLAKPVFWRVLARFMKALLLTKKA